MVLSDNDGKFLLMRCRNDTVPDGELERVSRAFDVLSKAVSPDGFLSTLDTRRDNKKTPVSQVLHCTAYAHCKKKVRQFHLHIKAQFLIVQLAFIREGDVNADASRVRRSFLPETSCKAPILPHLMFMCNGLMWQTGAYP
jgi:hypothetical protein